MESRQDKVSRLLFDYLKSPSLKHIRDPYQVRKLANDIVSALERGNPIWRKWNQAREELARAAIPCWIPIDKLADHLNQMDGPALTTTDVSQRLEAMSLEDYSPYPDERLKDGCLALFEKENSQSTELSAIVGVLNEFVDSERARLDAEHAAAYRARQENKRRALEQRFHSGADCKWTPINKSKEVYCRVNGRAFRLSPTPDRMWHLHRVDDAGEAIDLVGRYRGRREATAAAQKVAFTSV
jgi:hypothetical protein